MTTLSALRDRVRLELGDQPSSFQTSAISDGDNTRFEMPDKPLAPGLTLLVVNGPTTVPLVEGSDYSVSAADGMVTLAEPLTAGVTLIATGSAFRYFSDADIDSFVTTALGQHTLRRQDVFGEPMTVTDLPAVEEYPVVILATYDALFTLLTDAAFDIDIYAPDGVSIPRHQRYDQLMSLIAARKAQYEELCEKLNIGLSRIEMFKFRRTSRATGRLIPLYEEREVEDMRPARRVYLPTSTYGGEGGKNSAQFRLDLEPIARQAFVQRIEGLGDLTGLTLKAKVRTFPDAFAPLATMGVTVVDAVAGIVEVTLTSQQTFSIRRECFWDLQAQDETGNVETLVEGKVSVERQGGF